jgi:hypothetical protein
MDLQFLAANFVESQPAVLLLPLVLGSGPKREATVPMLPRVPQLLSHPSHVLHITHLRWTTHLAMCLFDSSTDLQVQVSAQ